MEAHILVVDDDAAIRDLIREYLTENDFQVSVAETGADMDRVLGAEIVDLVILDLKLPDEDGLAIARRLRESLDLPIIILTGRKEEVDRVMGLELGADDYVTKPFSMKVLMARVAAVLRRKASMEPAQSILASGPVVIDQAKHEVTVSGKGVNLTPTEFKLLTAILSARGRVMSRDQLMDRAMGTDVFVTDRAIDVHITAVRKKLGDLAWMIHTVRGVGYRLLERKEEENLA